MILFQEAEKKPNGFTFKLREEILSKLIFTLNFCHS